MSILKSTHTGKQSNLTLEYLQSRGYSFMSYWMVDFEIKDAQAEYPLIPEEFLAFPLQLKQEPNTKLMIAVKKKNGSFEFSFTLYLYIDEDGAAGSYTCHPKTLEDFDLIDKYINIEIEYRTTDKIVTRLRKDYRNKIVARFAERSYSIYSDPKVHFNTYASPVASAPVNGISYLGL